MSEQRSERSEGTDRQRGQDGRGQENHRLRPVQVARAAAEQIGELTGRAAEEVTGLRRTDDGWQVEVEVVEVHRVPETADVIGQYEVDVDDEGNLVSYRRVRRYARGQVREERG